MTASEKQQLIASCWPQCQSMGRHYARRRRDHSADDLAAAAAVGVCRAAEAWNGQWGTFWGYARARAKWALLDYLRDTAPVPRSAWERMQRCGEQLPKQRPLTGEECDTRPTVDVFELRDLLASSRAWLTWTERVFLRLHFDEGMTQKSSGAVLGMNNSQAHKSYCLVLAWMRERLQSSVASADGDLALSPLR